MPPERDRKTLLATNRFSVEHRSYEVESGDIIERGVVVHPGSVVILPLLDAERVVLIRNYRYAVERELLELPAGTREAGEVPLETARRELEEETGYRALEMQSSFGFYSSPGVMTEWMSVYVASGLTFIGPRPVAGEYIRRSILTWAEIRRRLAEGSFEDGKTIAVLSSYLIVRGGHGEREIG